MVTTRSRSSPPPRRRAGDRPAGGRCGASSETSGTCHEAPVARRLVSVVGGSGLRVCRDGPDPDEGERVAHDTLDVADRVAVGPQEVDREDRDQDELVSLRDVGRRVARPHDRPTDDRRHRVADEAEPDDAAVTNRDAERHDHRDRRDEVPERVQREQQTAERRVNVGGDEREPDDERAERHAGRGESALESLHRGASLCPDRIIPWCDVVVADVTHRRRRGPRNRPAWVGIAERRRAPPGPTDDERSDATDDVGTAGRPAGRFARTRGYPSGAVHDSSSVLPSGDVGPLLQRAVEEAARLLHADGGMVYLVDEESGDLRLTHDAGITNRRSQASVRGLRLPIGAGMFGKAFLERRVQLTNDYPSDAAFAHTQDADRVVRDAKIRSMVVAPLLDGTEALGALGAFASRPDAFGEADVALVRALAEHAAAAMANRRLIDRLARSEAELEIKADAERALREIGARITSSRNRSKILDQVVEEATRLLGADVATISLLADRGKAVGWGRAARPDLEPQLRMLDRINLDPHEGISGLAMSSGQAVWTNDYLEDERFAHTPDRDEYVRSAGVRSVVSAPLRDETGSFGNIQVSSTQIGAFGEREGSILAALADQASIALTNARLIEELDESRDDVARRAEVETSLRQIGARITALRDVDDVIQGTIDEAVRLLRGEGGRIDVVEPTSGLMRGIYLAGDAPPPDDVWPESPEERPDDGVSGQAVARNG